MRKRGIICKYFIVLQLKNVMNLKKINKITDFKYLNLYELELENRKGKQKDYYVASRREKDKLTCVTKEHNKADGVMIIPITKEKEFVVIKQYRPAIDGFIYEFPAGLIDDGETVEEASKRELFEETGLKCVSFEYLVKPSYTSVGMTDETVAIVKMLVEGIPTSDNAEEDEEIEILKVPMKDFKEFVKDNVVSIKLAMVAAFMEGI